MNLNKVTVNDIYEIINNLDFNSLTSLNEQIDSVNIYGENLQYRLVDNRIYNGLFIVDFVIPINFLYSKSPISIHFDVTQKDINGDFVIEISKPEIRTYSYNGWWKPKLILTESKIKTLDENEIIVDYNISPIQINKSDTVESIYRMYKARVTELNELKTYIEYVFNETDWDSYYNIANFQEIKKWKCKHISKRFSDYFKFLKGSENKYIYEMLLADNIFNNSNKHVLTKDLSSKYNFDKYKTLSEQVKKLISDKDLINEINKIHKIKENINKAQLEYDNEKTNLFHKIRTKYNIPLEELLIK